MCFLELVTDMPCDQPFIEPASAQDDLAIDKYNRKLMRSLLNRLHHIRKGKALGAEKLDILESDLGAEAPVKPFLQPVGSHFPCHLSAAGRRCYRYDSYRYGFCW